MQVFFNLHGPSFVSSILYKSAFMDLQLSDKASTLITVASYSRHLAGASVSFRHKSSYHIKYLYRHMLIDNHLYLFVAFRILIYDMRHCFVTRSQFCFER